LDFTVASFITIFEQKLMRDPNFHYVSNTIC